MKNCLIVVSAVLLGALTVCGAQAKSGQKKSAATAAKVSLADARNGIDKAISDPKEMTRVMKGLSAEDQKQFLADVNKAISDMPASPEEKAAKFLAINEAAVAAAVKGNSSTLVAETFATVPPEVLPLISERFAADLLNRTSNPKTTYTDAEFEKVSKEVMDKVNARCEETDNGSPRAAFAIAMLVRASGGTPADLMDKLVDTLRHDDAKELARKEWLPAALGKDGVAQSYEPLLASADAGRRPDYEFTLVVTGAQFHDALISDILCKNLDPKAYSDTHTPIFDAIENPINEQVPALGGDVGGDAAQSVNTETLAPGAGDVPHGDQPPVPTPEPEPPHPGPYGWQTVR